VKNVGKLLSITNSMRKANLSI